MKIVAIEKFLPSNRIESIEIDKLLGLKEGYIEKLTGVRSRYQVSANESVAQMGANALKKALNSACARHSNPSFFAMHFHNAKNRGLFLIFFWSAGQLEG